MAHKILIIDDDRGNVALVKFSLARELYDLSFAYDGDEGLKILAEEVPDLIILDIKMPGMNGYEFLAELKKSDELADIPVIMLTANETMEEVFKLEGIKGYFVKPVDIPKMLAKIEEILGPNQE